MSPLRRTASRWFPFAVVAIALVGALAACGSDSSDGGPSDEGAGEIEGIVRPDPLQVGDLSLPQVDAEGAETPFAFRAPEGELLFVAFGYTNCPDVCPTTLYDIKKARKDLGDDGDRVNVAFATVDPTRDTAKVITGYLGSFVPDGHPLRTTDPEALEAVEDGFGVTSQVVENADGSTDVSHTARSFVVDDQGNVVVEWSFGTGPEVMASDLRILLDRQDEAS